MKKQLKNALVAAVLLFITQSCASVGSPDGGPKDLQAPVLLESTPKDGQTNVNPKKIVLTFSEDVQAPELNRQLIVAPFTENTYKTEIKNETIELTFAEPWQENTTYSFNFRKSITDITERNPAENVTITFSTGNFLDSGRVSGNVNYLLNSAQTKDINVLLYPASDTAQVTKGRPLYVTQTDSTGNFAFDNIKLGNYYVYALAETNNNLRYDSEKEAIAFTQDSITVNPTVEGIGLRLHRQDKTKPTVLSRKSFLDTYEVEYNEGISNINVTSATAGSTTDIRWLVTNAGKTLRLYPSIPEDSKWVVAAHDSAGNVRTDTLNIRLSGARAPRANKSFQIANGASMKPGDTLKLQFEVPVKILDAKGAVTLIVDTATTVTTSEDKELILNQNQTKIAIVTPFAAKKEISVTIDTTKIVPFAGLPLNTSTQKIEISERTNVGSLKIALATEQQSFIVQLLQEKGIIRQTRNQKIITWENLPPGNYFLRILVDANQNGQWDNGDLSTRTLPEPVIIPPVQYEIRSNWDIIEENPIKF